MNNRCKVLVLGAGITPQLIRMLLIEADDFTVTLVENVVGALAAVRMVRPEAAIVDWDWQSAAPDIIALLRHESPELMIMLVASGQPLQEGIDKDIVVVERSLMSDALLPVMRSRLQKRLRVTPSRIPLGIGNSFVEPGAHLLWFHRGEDELRAAAGFFTAGLDSGDGFLVLGRPTGTKDKVLHFATEAGIDLRQLASDGRLAVIDRNPQDSRADVLEALEMLTRSGASHLRILSTLAGEWPYQDRDDVERILEWETWFHGVVPQYRGTLICPYNSEVTSGNLIVNVALECHPYALQDGNVIANPFYRSS